MNSLDEKIDFRSGIGFSRLAALTLNVVADRFRDEFGRRLATMLGGEPEVSRQPVQFQRGGLLAEQQWSDRIAYALETSSVPAGYAFLLVKRQEMLGLCQAVFGIQGPSEESGAATPLELVAEEMILRYLCQSLDAVWGGSAPGPWRKTGKEARVHRLEKFNSLVELAAWEFLWNHPSCKGTFAIAVERSLARRIARPSATALPIAPESKMLESAKIRGIPIPFSARLGVASLTVAEIRSLQPGDVVVLDQKVDDEHLVLVGDVPKLLVKAGRKGLRHACLVQAFVTDEMSVKTGAL